MRTIKPLCVADLINTLRTTLRREFKSKYNQERRLFKLLLLNE